MIQNMTKASIMIPVGGMYQEWSCLMDLVEGDTAKPRTIGRTYAAIKVNALYLQRIAKKQGWNY